MLKKDELAMILSNPFYCLRSIDPAFFQDHDVLVSEEDFITTAINLIEQDGSETYIRNLLKNLKGDFV